MGRYRGKAKSSQSEENTRRNAGIQRRRDECDLRQVSRGGQPSVDGSIEGPAKVRCDLGAIRRGFQDGNCRLKKESCNLSLRNSNNTQGEVRHLPIN